MAQFINDELIIDPKKNGETRAGALRIRNRWEGFYTDTSSGSNPTKQAQIELAVMPKGSNDETNMWTMAYMNVYDEPRKGSNADTKLNSHYMGFDCTLRTESILPERGQYGATSNCTYYIGAPDEVYKEVHSQAIIGNGTNLFLGPKKEAKYGHVVMNDWGVIYPQKSGGYQFGQTGNAFHSIYLTNGVQQVSDARDKEEIEYLEKKSTDITDKDCLEFIKNDLKLATYKMKSDEGIGKKQLGFIAQDIMDTKLGSLIVEKGETEEDRLTYSLSNYVNVLAGALKESLNKIDMLEKRLEKLEK